MPVPRTILVCVLILTTLASSQTDHIEIAGSTPAAQHVIGRHARHMKAEGVPNFGEVTPTLYRGGQPTREGFETLAHMGITIVVDTGRSKRDEAIVNHLGMQYVSLPWYCPFPKDKVFARFIEVTKENAHKRIFVHCRLGDDRTGMMIAAYRMAVQHWTAKEAMNEMHEFGYRNIHPLMCPGLGSYEKGFPRRLREDPVFENLR
jgi:tyrosine-protein phosphatase SIW14